ncbi:MAG: prepilin-type N-terminal cleavage/methylation domain-containing protein [Erysipelotrichaceae bacterium]|nr:prepilin-type N-terminal cleavage/methylation domain-containing protein [Erysipelotrichaceae bacterium]
MKNNKKGFTLAELLIVVAIIAVLVGISIPVFTTQLEKSREAVDLANIRAAYAECTANVLTDDANAYAKAVKVAQKTSGWITTSVEVAGVVPSDIVSTDTLWVKVDQNGVMTMVKSNPAGTGCIVLS